MPILGIMASAMSGNLFAPSGAYDSLSSVTLSATQSSITFSGIPATYTHLQIRMITLVDISTVNTHITVNSDSGSNYSWHELYGDGATVTAGAGATQTFMKAGITQSTTTGYTGAAIVDILDYANTNKYKTIRVLTGSDANGSGYAILRSGNWRNTNAITSITLTAGSNNLKQYSSFALYGVR
jgi:hypothetical protein